LERSSRGCSEIVTRGAVAAAIAAVVFVGLRARPAFADIFAPRRQESGFLAPPDGGTRVRKATALVNGQTFHIAIGHSRQRLDDVLAHFEGQLSTAARFGGGRVGVVSGLRIDPLARPADLATRLKRFASSTRLRDVGELHVITAFQDRGTVFIEFTPDPDVRLAGILPAGQADAPGSDVIGVRRPEGLQRLLTIQPGGAAAGSRTIIYRTRDAAAAARAFRQEFIAAAWTAGPATGGGVEHFSDGRREVFVSGGFAGSAAVVVVDRLIARPGHSS